ncbi:unnamed protein product [Euphydryas editha]|uniref:DUF7869 domain-containing protein n=1 Tax=Euphydryas editha TaxID=104508 RepID=A0AAU9TMN2_EUPED|nr:unnamed protein product [Euphydryas editha]
MLLISLICCFLSPPNPEEIESKMCISLQFPLTPKSKQHIDEDQKTRLVLPRILLSVQYYLPSATVGGLVRVCKGAFLSILNIKKDRVTGVLQRSFNVSGAPAIENRGGDHRSAKNIEKRLAIHSFIESLKCTEPHYCRSKSQCRMYLSSELNIKKLWQIYNCRSDCTKKVKESFFRKVFNGTYNLSFGSPRTDACSRCIELNEKVKTTADLNLKQEYIVQKRIHALKAKVFYNLLQTNEEHVITMSFYCQKNMTLPKLPDQSAYFSRQINFYNFTVVVGTSKSKLEKENVFMYYWNEAERPKGSNEISSAVFHCLQNIIIPRTVDTVRLFADGCGGQNKNTTMIGMCSKFLFTHAPRSLKKIEIIFPIVGHSFLPPDRVFAKIEKTLRKKEIITDPQQYVDILQVHGTTFNLGQESPYMTLKKNAVTILSPLVLGILNLTQPKDFF